MKNGFFVAIVLAVWGAIKLIGKVLWTAIQVLASIIMFLGLYIPLFYLVFGLILLAATDFTFGGMGTDQILYYIGLGLCCVAAIIITVRNLLIRPFSSVFKALRPEKDPQYDDDGEEERPSRGERADRRRYGYDDPYYDEPTRDPREGYGARPYVREPYPPRREDPYEPSPTEGTYRPRPSYVPEPPISEAERPLVYYSRRRPGILVKEYSDRFELYREDASGRTYIGTEYKED